MALLDWTDLSWDEFVAGVRGYRENFAPKDREDVAYFRSLDVIQARPPAARGGHSADIVLLLNRWACRLSSERAPRALEEWLGRHIADLEELEPLTISDPGVPQRAEALGALHDDLIHQMRANGVNNMADAAASKALHLLQPRLFVMWDKEIRRSAPEGYGSYLLQMHALARRLLDEAPTDDIEAHLQELLGYETRKTLAKYLDEHNWFEAVGREQLTARRDRSRGAPG
jgi:hypothetical protein